MLEQTHKMLKPFKETRLLTYLTLKKGFMEVDMAPEDGLTIKRQRQQKSAGCIARE